MSRQAPRFIVEGYGTIDVMTGKWILNPDTPNWAKTELKGIKKQEKESKKKGINL